MTTVVTDSTKRKALLWEAVGTMILRYGGDWRDRLDSIQRASVDEIFSPLGTIEDWAARALDEAEEARLAGDWVAEMEGVFIFDEILASGKVAFH